MQDDPARRTKNKGLCFEVGAYIRGLEFRVLNESAMKLRQTTGMQKGCEAITAWKMSVCTSCCCNIGGVAGLVDNMMIVTLTKESAKDMDCSTWFIQMDKALRQYNNYGINSCNGNRYENCVLLKLDRHYPTRLQQNNSARPQERL